MWQEFPISWHPSWILWTWTKKHGPLSGKRSENRCFRARAYWAKVLLILWYSKVDCLCPNTKPVFLDRHAEMHWKYPPQSPLGEYIVVLQPFWYESDIQQNTVPVLWWNASNSDTTRFCDELPLSQDQLPPRYSVTNCPHSSSFFSAGRGSLPQGIVSCRHHLTWNLRFESNTVKPPCCNSKSLLKPNRVVVFSDLRRHWCSVNTIGILFQKYCAAVFLQKWYSIVFKIGL